MGELLSSEGYFALLVDGFGPRGYPAGFGRDSYKNRPEELNEVTVRPLDAYGAAAYLRSLPGVAKTRLGLLGWSNGGSATLASMSPLSPGVSAPDPDLGFGVAVAFYPGCGLKGKYNEGGYHPYSPVRVFHGLADEETSPHRCSDFVDAARAEGGDIAITLYTGATHNFDDPGHQRIEANATAAEDATRRTLLLFDKRLR